MEVAIKPDHVGRRLVSSQPKRQQHFFPVPSHAPVWRVLRTSIVRGEGVIRISGAAGSGKSLFLLRLQGILPENRDMALFPEPDGNTVRFMEQLIRALDPDWESLAPDGLPTGDDLQEALEKRAHLGKKLLVAIDQAQLLTPEHAALLELMVRHHSRELRPVQVLLCGTHELIPLLETPSFLSLRQLLIGSGEVTPMTRSEVWDYIHFHLKKNWGDHYRVSWFAWVEIFSRSQGNPGKINEILNQVAALLKIRPQKIISRNLVRKAIEGRASEVMEHQRSPVLLWSVIVILFAGIGWSASHFIFGLLEKKNDTVHQVTETVPVDEILKKPEPENKGNTPPAVDEKTASTAKPGSTGTPSRILYSPVAPPEQKKSTQPEEPWIPRDRKNMAAEPRPNLSAEPREQPARNETKAIAEKEDEQQTPTPVTPSPPPNEKVSPPSASASVSESASASSSSTPATPAPREKATPVVTKSRALVTPPEQPSSIEKKDPAGSPKAVEPTSTPTEKQSADKPASTVEERPVPEPYSTHATSPPPLPVPPPRAVAHHRATTAPAPTPAQADLIGKSVAALIEGTTDTLFSNGTPSDSGASTTEPSRPMPTPLKRNLKKTVPTPEKTAPAPTHAVPSPTVASSHPPDPVATRSAAGHVNNDPVTQSTPPLVSEENLRAAGQLFVVQTGSFLNRENAERLAATMAEKGLDPYVHLLVKDNKKWFSVRVNYRDSKTAMRMADQVRKDVGLPTQVIDLFYE